MKMLIDADACPDIDDLIEIARSKRIETLLVCDTSHLIERDGIQTLVVSKGSDAVDFMLLGRVSRGDVVVTQDYGLAALVLSKQAFVLHVNGWEYTADNIEALLMNRHLNKKVRMAGGRHKGATKRTAEQRAALLAKLTEIIDNRDDRHDQ